MSFNNKSIGIQGFVCVSPVFQASMEAQSFQAATALAQSEREEDAAQFSQELNFVNVNLVQQVI